MDKKMFSKFVWWMSERHAIYLKKEAGEPWPWTKDKILQEYKFTNPFRQNDAVTKLMWQMVHKDFYPGPSDGALFLFNIVLFRLFNWPDTYAAFKEAGLTDKWVESKAVRLLAKRKAEGKQNFTGAYMVTNANSHDEKHVVYSRVATEFWKVRHNLFNFIAARNTTLEEVNDRLRGFPMVGPFIAYELVTDFRHVFLENAPDIMTWANPGPGAKRGLNRIYNRPTKQNLSHPAAIGEMRELLSKVNAVLSSGEEKYSHMPAAVEMRDIEHSLCEFDKYMRVANGEGRPRSKYHPK